MDTSKDKYLDQAQNKARYMKDTSWSEGHEGALYFWRQSQLRKGSAGETRADAIYYWSEHEGMTSSPSPLRSPVYRTLLQRKLPKESLGGSFNFKSNGKKKTTT